MAELRGRSLPELRDMLRRQQRLLADRRFVARLPDGGRKVAELADRLGRAVRQEEQRAATRDGWGTSGEGDGKTPETGSNGLCEMSPASAARRGLGSEQQLPQDNAQGGAEGAGGSEHSKDLLADAFQKVSIADAGDSGGAAEREQSGAKHRGNVFGSLYAKTPHYIEVLESRAKNPIVKKNKFKTNILSGEQSGSSHHHSGTSSSQSPEGSGSLMTPEERRLRDKKHLNDITAARLPPLHHAPAKLLSIEESIAIQIQQKEAYEEMQAKLAAQKLAERLNIKMTRFEPEGEASMQYREVRDEDYLSEED